MKHASMIACALTVGALVLGCGGTEEQEQGDVCAYSAWRGCTQPSLEARSAPWPALRSSLAALADQAESASASPDTWGRFSTITEPSPDFTSEWESPVSLRDRDERGERIRSVAFGAETLCGAQLGVAVGASRAVVDDFRRARSSAHDAFDALQSDGNARDPFGQLEPRRPLFAYAYAATVLQFAAQSAAGRHELATRAAAWLEKRLDEWESMQRERLAGRPPEEVQAAVDGGGGVEIRRLIASWSKLETLPPSPH